MHTLLLTALLASAATGKATVTRDVSLGSLAGQSRAQLQGEAAAPTPPSASTASPAPPPQQQPAQLAPAAPPPTGPGLPALEPPQSFLAHKPAAALDESAQTAPQQQGSAASAAAGSGSSEPVFDLLTGGLAPPGQSAFSAAGSTNPSTPGDDLKTAQFLRPLTLPQGRAAQGPGPAAAAPFASGVAGAWGPAPASGALSAPLQGQSCNPRNPSNSTLNGCARAGAACPLRCTKQSQPRCGERFACEGGCPTCRRPPPNAYCYNSKQVELTMLDTTIGYTPSVAGNLTYWFEGDALHLTFELLSTMAYQPIAVYVNRTAPDGPPPEQTQDGVLKDQARGAGWDVLVAPHTSCVTYTKDLAPLYYGDEVHISLATFACHSDGTCNCRGGSDDQIGGNVCIFPPVQGRPIPTSSTSRFLRPPYDRCQYVTARKCAPGFVASDTGDACLIDGMRCPQANACGSGPFPAYSVACAGVNPEGADLGLTPRCATNAYDSQGYATLDFTCDAAACAQDADCLTGYMCAAHTPCLTAGPNATCTARCVPAAAAFCRDFCPNALASIPSPYRPSASLSGLSGAALAKALGGRPGSSQGRSGASKWFRSSSENAPAPPLQAEVSRTIDVGQ